MLEPGRCLFLLVVTVSYLTFQQWPARAHTRPPVLALRPLDPCEGNFVEKELPSYTSTKEGRALFQQVLAISQILPLDTRAFANQLAPQGSVSVADLMQAILQKRKEQANKIFRLRSATSWQVIRQALDDTGHTVRVRERQRPLYLPLLETHWQRITYQQLTEEVTHIRRTGRTSPNATLSISHYLQAENSLQSAIGSHGYIAELIVAFQVPGLVAIRARVRDLLTDEEADAVTQFFRHNSGALDGTREDNEILNREVDVVYDGGRKWLEVKNSASPFSMERVAESLLQQQLQMIDASRMIENFRQRDIQLQCLFLRGGVRDDAARLLISLGVQVFTADRLPWETVH